MEILYVVTFNKRLFEKSGIDLIKSFVDNNIISKLLVCYEGFNFSHKSEKVIGYNLEKDQYMNLWMKNNIDIIPDIYGGNAKDNNPIFLKDKKKGQPWARYRSAGYFRKVVALNHAIDTYSNKFDIICVIDCDCIFKTFIPNDIFDKVFNDGTQMFFYWSDYRKKINRGPETGFTGYCKKNGGYEFAKIICKSFITQDFLRFEYWDDGFVIGQLIKENNDKFKLKDIVRNTKKCTTRVMDIEDNIFFNYVKHFKNKHDY